MNERHFGFKLMRFQDRNIYAGNSDPKRKLNTDGSWNTCHAPKKALELCWNGIHVWNNFASTAKMAHELSWESNEFTLWLVELKGKILSYRVITNKTKSCARKARFIMKFDVEPNWWLLPENTYASLVKQFNDKFEVNKENK